MAKLLSMHPDSGGMSETIFAQLERGVEVRVALHASGELAAATVDMQQDLWAELLQHLARLTREFQRMVLLNPSAALPAMRTGRLTLKLHLLAHGEPQLYLWSVEVDESAAREATTASVCNVIDFHRP